MANTGGRQHLAQLRKSQSQRASMARKPLKGPDTKTHAAVVSNDSVNPYSSSQRHLIGQYQNAVTPPPVIGGQ
jgi:hypothetical protein